MPPEMYATDLTNKAKKIEFGEISFQSVFVEYLGLM